MPSFRSGVSPKRTFHMASPTRITRLSGAGNLKNIRKYYCLNEALLASKCPIGNGSGVILWEKLGALLPAAASHPTQR